jgi:hypothetical protein
MNSIEVAHTTIPDPEPKVPETGFCDLASQRVQESLRWKTNKNKGILREEITAGLVFSVLSTKNVDAFRSTIFTSFRARGKGLAPGHVTIVPTCRIVKIGSIYAVFMTVILLCTYFVPVIVCPV